MTRFTVAAFVSLLLLATGGPGLASAQDMDERVARARALFERAEAHFAGGEYLPAAAAYQNAYDLMREAGRSTAPLILYNVGRAYDRAGQADHARAAYQRFIAEAPADDSEAQARAGMARERLRAMQAPAPAQAPQAGGETHTGTTTASDGGGFNPSPVGFIVGGVGVAMAVAGIITGVMASSDFGTLSDRCPSMVCAATQENRDLQSSGETLALVTDVMLWGGLAVAATGVILLFVLPGDEGGGSDDPTASLACTHQGCYGDIRLRF